MNQRERNFIIVAFVLLKDIGLIAVGNAELIPSLAVVILWVSSSVIAWYYLFGGE